MSQQECPSADELKALLLGDVEGEVSIGMHVESCDACQALLETLSSAAALKTALARLHHTDELEISPPCRQAMEKLEQAGSQFSETCLGADVRAVDRALPENLGSYEVIEKLATGGIGAV